MASYTGTLYTSNYTVAGGMRGLAVAYPPVYREGIVPPPVAKLIGQLWPRGDW